MDLVASVTHDAASLCQFIDQMAVRCVLSESPSYTEASKEFFSYIYQLGDASKKHLQQFITTLNPGAALNDPDAFCTDAQQIQTLRYSWFKLHRFIKPSLDADTLEVPHTLVSVLVRRLQELPGFANAHFAVLHTADLNYYQITTSHIERLASEIASIVSNAPSFPRDLGLIVIPYSQSSSLFLNSALAHEMGHFAFSQRSEHIIIYPQIINGLLQHKDLAKIVSDPLLAQLCIDRCLGWLTEIYCDLFALYLVGPCFSFGFIELFALSRINRSSSKSGTSSPVYSLLEFSESHPAEALRLREQVKFLKRPAVSWWDQVHLSNSSHVQLLREAADVTDDVIALDPQSDTEHNKIALDVFLNIVPSIHLAIEEAFKGVSTELASFLDQKELIQTYLSYGVVPSRLIKDKVAYVPSAIALLNAAHFFYIDNLDDLLSRIESVQASCLECRSMWAEKIEMWTTKALEDVIH